MPPTILHLITELSNGGAQSALLRLLEQMDRDAFEPTVACYYNGHTPLAERIRVLGVPVHDLGMKARTQAGGLLRLYTLLRRMRPEILHTWMFHANVPGRVVGRLARVPVILSSERTMGQESAWRRRLNRATARLADRIICVSDNVRDYAETVIGLPQSKLMVIPNGVDLTAFRTRAVDFASDRSAQAAEARLLYVGRLEQIKGVDTLINAANRLPMPGEGCPWALTIVGEGSQRAALQECVHALHLDARVTFLGDRQDVADLLPLHDLFVLPSRCEGMPNAALEAMACALPVVATAVGGTPEVVVDGETGLLVAPEDPETLAAALAVLLGDPERRTRMGLAGRARVEQHFSLAISVARTESLYRQLLATRESARE